MLTNLLCSCFLLLTFWFWQFHTHTQWAMPRFTLLPLLPLTDSYSPPSSFQLAMLLLWCPCVHGRPCSDRQQLLCAWPRCTLKTVSHITPLQLLILIFLIFLLWCSLAVPTTKIFVLVSNNSFLEPRDSTSQIWGKIRCTLKIYSSEIRFKCEFQKCHLLINIV